MNMQLAKQTSGAVKVQQIATPGGLAAWLVEDYAVPLVSLDFAFKGGAAQDGPDKAGLATMLASLLDEGAGELDSDAFHEALDEKAIEISFHADRDHIGGRMRTLARNLDAAADLLALSLAKPRFDEDAVARVHEQLAASLRHEANDPSAMSGRAWRAGAFPGHPYGRPPAGTLESLNAIARAEIALQAHRLITRGALHIGIVGAIDAARAGEILERIFGALPADGKLDAIQTAQFTGLGRVEILDLDVPQSTIRFGRPALSRHDGDYIASQLAAQILGGGPGMTSRLFREVRDKRGLAYSVSANVANLDAADYLQGSTTTKNERAYESLDVIVEQIRDIAQNGPSAAELDKAKKYMIGSYPLRFDTSSKIAGQLVQMQLDGYSPQWLIERNQKIAAVSEADARRAAGRLLGDGSLNVVMVGRPTKG